MAGGKGRRALATVSTSDANVSAGKLSDATAASPSPLPVAFHEQPEKEQQKGLSLLLSPPKKTGKRSKNSKSKPAVDSACPKASAAPPPASGDFADALQELQGRLEQLRLEKEKTEESLRQREELLKKKEEEIEHRGKEQDRLQKELKKLQKLKEFKPTMNLPLFKSLREKEQEEKAKKKNKDTQEKKKPCPAYILWCKDQWNNIKKENTEADFKEVSNALGAKWKTLSAEEKKPYEERYQQEKEAYLQVIGQEKREQEAMKLLEEEQMQKTAMELLEQYLQFKQEADKDGKKVRKEKDPMKPKQPLTAFFLFSKERRETLLEQKKGVVEISKIAGEEWKNMTEEQRVPYEEMAKKQREEYNQQMEIYKQKKLEEAASLEKEEEEQKKFMKQEALQLLKKKEKTENIIKKTKQQKKKHKEEQNGDPNRPKKPPSSFLVFSKETRKQLLEEKPGISNSTLSAMISVKWKELSVAEKQVWNEKAAEAMAMYKKEMEDYKLAASSVQ